MQNVVVKCRKAVSCAKASFLLLFMSALALAQDPPTGVASLGTSAASELSSAETVIIAIGAAVIGVIVIICAIRLIRKVLG